METQTTTPVTKLRRAGRAIGSSYLVCNADTPTVFVKIESKFLTDDSGKREQTYLNVVDLETNSKEKLWVGGQLKHILGQPDVDMVGKSFEINWTGLKQVVDEATGEIREINNYKVFPLAAALK